MEADPATLPWKSVYKLMIGSILPRPIGWISTVGASGQAYLAPFSFFEAAGWWTRTIAFRAKIRKFAMGTESGE
jgi:flavin reductase (DIM6/NTAB) family NADH-FMN oxidoreductase RutF